VRLIFKHKPKVIEGDKKVSVLLIQIWKNRH